MKQFLWSILWTLIAGFAAVGIIGYILIGSPINAMLATTIYCVSSDLTFSNYKFIIEKGLFYAD